MAAGVDTPIDTLVAEAARRHWERMSDSPEAQVDRMVSAYAREFAGLGWNLEPARRTGDDR